MAEPNDNTLSLLLFRFQEKVNLHKDKAIVMWKTIPAESMLFFGAEVLASGVVMSAITRATGLDKMRWPGDLVVILGLGLPGKGQEVRVGHALMEISESIGLDVNQNSQMNNSFLELLQWMVVDELHKRTDLKSRDAISSLLQGKVSEGDREEVLTRMTKVLSDSGIDAISAREFFESALNRALSETVEVFTEKLPAESLERVKRMIS